MFRFKKKNCRADAVSRTENRIRAAVHARQLRILHSPTGKARSIRRSYLPGTRRFLSSRLQTRDEGRRYSASLTRNVRKCFGTYAIEAHCIDWKTINTSRVWFWCFPESLANNRCNGSRLCLWMCHISADILRRTRERDIKGKDNCARDIVVLGNAREYACTRILHDSLEFPTRLASSFPYVFLFV